jgi:thioredoxin 1
MKEVVLAFVIALVIGAAINGWNGAGSDANPSPQEKANPAELAGGDASLIHETTDADWTKDVTQSSQPVLVDFYIENCAPCKEMTPVVAKVASDFAGKVKVYRVDAQANGSAARECSVQTIPTFVILKDGKVADFYTGIVPYKALHDAVAKVAG